MKTLFVSGVCGVDKSTITSELTERLDCIWGDYADVILEIMGESEKVKIKYLDRDNK